MKAERVIQIDQPIENGKPLRAGLNHMVKVKPQSNPRRWLYVIYVPLLLIEHIADLIREIVAVCHKSIESITLALQQYIINEPDRPKPSE